MQQGVPVPPALVQTTCNFQNSATRRRWQTQKVASPGSISEISFRTINLRAALKQGDITDYATIRTTFLELDHDLASWEAGLPPSWKYISLDNDQTSTGNSFAGRHHLYPNNWVADAWNNWRTLRILVNNVLLENEEDSVAPDLRQIADSASVIHQLSADICISIHSFGDNPRTSRSPDLFPIRSSPGRAGILSLIQPLYLVALTELNTRTVRTYAVTHLRRIAASTGVRQAVLLADTATQSIGQSTRLSNRILIEGFGIPVSAPVW